MKIARITPIIHVDAIEDVLPFWTDKLGFVEVARVPHGSVLGFVVLVHGETTVMLQTYASLDDDMPDAVRARFRERRNSLYVDVTSIDDVISAVDGLQVLVPRRTTFYGADEIWVLEPSGNIVGFAHQTKKPS